MRKHIKPFEINWAKNVNTKGVELKAEHYIFYNILRGVNPRRGFADCINLEKLTGGYLPGFAKGLIKIKELRVADGDLKDILEFLKPFQSTAYFEATVTPGDFMRLTKWIEDQAVYELDKYRLIWKASAIIASNEKAKPKGFFESIVDTVAEYFRPFLRLSNFVKR